MNEPHRGYIELHNMYAFDPNTDLQFGYHPSAVQSFALGDGFPQVVPYYKPSFPHPTAISHHVLLNEKRERAWEEGKSCIWRDHGVWEWDRKAKKPVVLRQTFFERDPRTGEKYDWYRNAWIPFLVKFRQRMVNGSSRRGQWMIFAAGIPNEVTTCNSFSSKSLAKLSLIACNTLAKKSAARKPDFISAFLRSARSFFEGKGYIQIDDHEANSLQQSFGNITFNVQGLSRVI